MSVMRYFLQTCFVRDWDSDMDFDVVWRRWVWFAQTCPETREFWPYPLPAVQQALSTSLKRQMMFYTKQTKTTFKRGDRHIDNQPESYTRVRGLALRPKEEAIWEDMYRPWFPKPWIKAGSDLGNPISIPDPLGIFLRDIRLNTAKALREAKRRNLVESSIESQKKFNKESGLIRRKAKAKIEQVKNTLWAERQEIIERHIKNTKILIPPPIVD